MASSCTPWFTILYVDLLLSLGGIPSVKFCVSQILDAPLILTVRPERILLRNATLFDPAIANPALRVRCQIPDTFNKTAFRELALYFTAFYGPQAGRENLLAFFNSSVEGVVSGVRDSGVTATGGTKDYLINYSVNKATCQNAGKYKCQLVTTDRKTSSRFANFIYSLPPGSVRTYSRGHHNRKLVLRLGHVFAVNCTASVGTVAGEEVSWVWEVRASEEGSRWRNVTNTTVTTRKLSTSSSYHRCPATVQRATFTIRPRKEYSDSQYRCYVRKNGVSFSKLAGIFSVHIYHPLKKDPGSSKVWVIILSATVCILFLVLLFVLFLARSVNKSIKYMPASIPQVINDTTGGQGAAIMDTPLQADGTYGMCNADDLPGFVETKDLKLANPWGETSSTTGDTSSSSSRQASDFSAGEGLRRTSFSLAASTADNMLGQMQSNTHSSGFTAPGAPPVSSGEGPASTDFEPPPKGNNISLKKV